GHKPGARSPKSLVAGRALRPGSARPRASLQSARSPADNPPNPHGLGWGAAPGSPRSSGGERLSPIIRRPHGFTARSAGAAALVCVLAGIAGSARDALAGRHTHPAARTSIELKGLDPDDQALWQRLCFRVQDAFDSTYGGFVTRQGVVSESAIDLAFLLGRREGQQRWRGCGVYTVQWMLRLEDSVGGGFYRRREVVAGQGQFDRPTVTNARRLENLIDAWEATNDSRYWVSAVRLLEFAERNVV